jgi:hypothetical protein
MAFYKSLKKLRIKRNQFKHKNGNHNEILKKSIIYLYFIKKLKYFKDIYMNYR